MNAIMKENCMASPLVSEDSRGRKNIPLAVFAVIAVHVSLFLVLLVAAGCRAKTRATRHLESSGAGAPAQPVAQLAAVPSPVQPATAAAALPAPVALTPPLPSKPAGSLGALGSPAATSVRAVVPVAVRTEPAASAARLEGRSGAGVYVVRPGDTVEKIARRHGTTVRALQARNKLKGSIIRPGQKLWVETGAGEARDSKGASRI